MLIKRRVTLSRYLLVRPIRSGKRKRAEDEDKGPSHISVQQKLEEKKKGIKRNAASLDRKKMEGPKEMSRYAPKTSRIKKPHRHRPGKVALQEIQCYKMSIYLLIRKMPFQWLTGEITQEMMTSLHFIADSTAALQEAAEAFYFGCLKTSIYVQFMQDKLP